MRSVRILAPAKLNLGLAILGKRPDGYHEIDTIMAMVDLCDEIVISEDEPGRVSIAGMDDVPTEYNLMWKAAQLWSEAEGIEPAWKIKITKRIPSPAGFGGGSSDAAAVLKALNHLHGQPVSPDQLHQLAAQAGADCPFFLYDACARATGIGTDIEPIPSPTGWAILAVPRIESLTKTASLYAALTPDDYGDSADIDSIQRQIAYPSLAEQDLPNSFMSAASEAFPGLPSVITEFRKRAGNVSLSGSGPAIFSLTNSEEKARAWAHEMEQRVAENVSIHVVQFLKEAPGPEVQHDQP